jgi:hypothetical protein
VSEKDLPLKAAVRRLLWRGGYSTRVDVPLKGYVPRERGKPAWQEFTDLDVLAVAIGPGVHVQTAIADCKTSATGSTERMFWIRGVADFFGTENAYMVRSRDVTAAARQLSARLNIAVLTLPDLKALETYQHLDTEIEAGPVARLFDSTAIHAHHQAFTTLDKRLRPLIDYRQFDYWIYDPYRNLTQMVTHLSDAATLLEASNPLHLSLLFDCTWLYLITLARAVEHVRGTHAVEVRTVLAEYLFGGQLELREKQQMAKLFEGIAKVSRVSSFEVLPQWFDTLLELVGRLLRNPNAINPALRYCEWLSESLSARQRISVSTAFGKTADPHAAKMAADVVGFLVAAAGLRPGIRQVARELLVNDFMGGGERAPHSQGLFVESRLETSAAVSSGPDAQPPEKAEDHQQSLLDLGEAATHEADKPS